MKTGLMYISQESALLGEISYHDYQGIVIDTQERELIARDLGPVNKVSLYKSFINKFLFNCLSPAPSPHHKKFIQYLFLQVMILRNHGVIVCGESIEEALFYLQNLVLACEAQVCCNSYYLDY